MTGREIRVGVKDLLDLLFHAKDLGSDAVSSARGQEGSQGHRHLVARRPDGYRPEVPIEFAFEWSDYTLVVRGRMDGFIDDGEAISVEEIKTTYIPLADLGADRYPAHMAQLKLYMYFVMCQNPGRPVSGLLTYLNLSDLSERTFRVDLSIEDGRSFFEPLARAFLSARRERDEWLASRNASLSLLKFPFSDLRAGQQELMDMVELALDQQRDLFVEAATGIGKTIGVLYPALQGLATGERYSQIFFLTAKTAGKEILKKTLSVLKGQGLHLRTVFIEAKERTCQTPGRRCHPDECPYAADYYARAAELVPALLAEELILPETVMGYARKYQVCPFELSLDLALQADLIVGDYNYVFDPRAYLKRFFLFGGHQNYLFLVDEAHNLVTRGREMYSASLSRPQLEAMRATVSPVDGRLAQALTGVDVFFDRWVHEMGEERRSQIKLGHLPDMMEPALEQVSARLEQFLRQQEQGERWQSILKFYFEWTAFTRVAAQVDDNYAIYVKEGEEGPSLHLFCLNPGPLLRRRLDTGRCAVFFSATLTPFDYFHELLGGGPDAIFLSLTSPFPRENRLYLHVPGVDTRYRARESTAMSLAKCAGDMVKARDGNYLMFFPSYAYLQAVAPMIKQLLHGGAAVHVQYPSMGDAQKLEFIRKVTSTASGHSNLGLAILGGLFGEGVDMPGEQLVGVLLVGPGLPVVSEEQELIRAYFDERNGQGFLFAYLIPGLIRVIQSAGRVFRTPEDRGVVVLVDDRFADERYQELLPSDWFMPGRAFTRKDYEEALREFWQG